MMAGSIYFGCRKFILSLMPIFFSLNVVVCFYFFSLSVIGMMAI